MKLKTLKHKLIFWFTVISTIPLLVALILVYFYRSDYIFKQESEKLTAIRDLKVAEINLWLDYHFKIIDLLSENENIINYYQSYQSKDENIIESEIYNYLVNYTQHITSIKQIYIINTSNKKLEISTENNKIVSVEDSACLDEITNKNKMYYVNSYNHPKTKQAELIYAKPLISKKTNKNTGIIVCVVDLQNGLFPILNNRTGLGKTGETLIVDKNKFAINQLRWFPNNPLEIQIKSTPVFKALKGETNLEIAYDYRNKEVLAAYTFINKTNWGFVAKIDTDEIYEPINQLVYSLTILFFILLFVIYLVAVFIAGTISKPLIKISDDAKKIGKGEFDIRNQVSNIDEVGILATSLNEMAEMLQTSFITQKGRQEIAEKILLCTELNNFWEKLASIILEITKADSFIAYEFDETANSFTPIYSNGIKSITKEPISIEAIESLLGNSLILKQSSGNTDSNYILSCNVNCKPITNDSISFAILAENKTKGIVSIFKKYSFHKEVIDILNQSLVVINSVFGILYANRITKKIAEELAVKNSILNEQQDILQQKNLELHKQQQKLSELANELQIQYKELEKQSKIAEEANRLKSEFLSNISHELRTPLNSILALSRVLIVDGEFNISTKEKNYLEIIERNGKSLLGLINRILDLAKIESGKVDFNITVFDLNRTIQTIIENNEQLVLNKELALITQYDKSLPLIESDENKVMQIVQNLFINALKFTEKGNITIQTSHAENQIEVSVMDTGIGIPDEAIDYVFDEFRQVDGTISRKYEGSGLGLAIAKKNVELLGGKIIAKSTIGIGSEFIFRLPVNCNIKDYNPEQNKSYETEQNMKIKKSILLINDNNLIYSCISKETILNKFHIVNIDNPLEIEHAVIKYKPVLLILNLMNKTFCSITTIKNLLSNQTSLKIPFLALTSETIKSELFNYFNENQVNLCYHQQNSACGDIAKKVDFILSNLSQTENVIENNDVTIQENEKKFLKPEFHKLKKIIIIEDNPDNLETILAILKNRFTVISANDGKTGIKKIEEENPDLIILDILLPDMNGIEVVKYIRSNFNKKNVPVIALTAQAMKGDKEKILSSGCNQYLAKPIDPVALIESINLFLKN